ncbi:hypothetical protein GGR34_001777 [Microvirga flocculans]|uniref:Uncharacterized protein n=1 Tax=Microvirga flocculans TaxID=217168 RepID=A0A7W6N814_9HYPH|nr:hypothetical protein [Microvirga flocculans]MBB4040126.1 hypothetical protein [Microvirga flocculans]
MFLLCSTKKPDLMPNDASSPTSSDPGGPLPSLLRDKLAPERIAQMREWVEDSTRSFKRIGTALGISRYAAEGGWRRHRSLANRAPDAAQAGAGAARRSAQRRPGLANRAVQRHSDAYQNVQQVGAGASLRPSPGQGKRPNHDHGR